MIGALLVVNLRSRSDLPGAFHIGWAPWMVLLGLNALISLIPGVDGMAHLGGLLSGAAVALVLVPKDLDDSRSPIAAAVAGGALAIGYVSAFGLALTTPKDAPQAEFLHAAFDSTRLSARSLNSIAWLTAIHPTTTQQELAKVERAMKRVVDENPRNGSYRDTYAYTLHRQGRFEEAFEEERIALIDVDSKASDPALYTMFFRLLMERGPVNASAATVWRDGNDLVVESTIPGAVIFIGHPENGLARIIMPQGKRQARLRAPRMLSGDQLSVWLVDGAGPEQRISTARINFAPRDSVVATLP